MRTAGVLVLTGLSIALAGPAAAAEQIALPVNDLNKLIYLTGVQAPTPAPVQSNPEPPLRATPAAKCGKGSDPLEAVQGRVPASAIESDGAEDGWTCNLKPTGTYPDGPGGWRVWRYIDRAGHECAFYDQALVQPAMAIKIPGLPNTGVAVLDMKDPSRPKQTDLLTALPMQTSHESLNLNSRRGLLAAEMGNGGTAPGLMAVYSVKEDCRHPEHMSTTLASRTGHESGFAPDGKTFWIGGGAGLAAIDVSDPRRPKNIWEGAEFTHGMSLSRNGKRIYLADPINGNLTILDVSEVEQRLPDPQVREISRLTWKTVSIPQNTAPMTIRGKPYALEFDEFNFRFTAIPQNLQQVGAARIIDIADETRPRVVSNLRLQVNQPETHSRLMSDPGGLSPAQGYSAHYCAIPRELDPQIVACSFIGSGLRIFDIRKPKKPREVAYYVAPPASRIDQLGAGANLAMSQPAFAPERREVWYTDALSGFHTVKLKKGVWPDPVKRPKCRECGPGKPPSRAKSSSAPVTGAQPLVAWNEADAQRIALICAISLNDAGR